MQNVPKQWDGMTLEDMFHDVKDRSKVLRNRMIEETGSTLLTEEWVDKLPEEDKEVIQMNQFFKNQII